MPSPLTEAALAGFAAGITVAATPGAVSALMIDLGARRGLRPALSAGAGVATVDGIYAIAAAWFGAALAGALSPVAGALPFIGAAALSALALIGLRRLARADERWAPPPTARRPFATFMGLTAANPTTVVVFTAVAAGLADASWSTGARCGFAGAAFAASLGWHALLASGSALLGGIPPRGRTIVAIACHVAVLCVAAGMVLGR